jgi:hypothetical protein
MLFILYSVRHGVLLPLNGIFLLANMKRLRNTGYSVTYQADGHSDCMCIVHSLTLKTPLNVDRPSPKYFKG